MALSFASQTHKVIEFPEFIEFVKKTIDPDVPETVIDCTEHLQQLSNNSDFLIDYLNTELENVFSFQRNNFHSSQSLTLYLDKKFYIRANTWPASEIGNSVNSSTVDELYASLTAHDHNFNFLTVGYFGGGYETEIWDYEHNKVIGYVGEKIDMNFLETTYLNKGKAMFYRASKDIHIQFPANDFSMSLNIMPLTKEVVRREQFWFNLKEKTIRAIAANGGTGRYLILELAKKFGNEQTRNIIEQLADQHHIPYVRMKSYDALAILNNDYKKTWEKALADKHAIVSEHAKMKLNNN